MKKSVFLLLAAFSVAACSKTISVEAPKPEEKQAAADTGRFVSGVSIVFLSEEMTELIEGSVAQGKVVTKSMAMNSAIDELGVKSIARLFPHAGEFEPRTRKEGLHRWYKLSYDKEVPSTKAGLELSSIKGVELVEQQHRIKRSDFIDTYLSKQWHFHNKNKPGVDINVKPVWENYTTGAQNVIVSVVDGGIDLAHEDLAGNCIPGGKDGSKNFVSNNYVITADAHGTHVGGTIGAINNNIASSVCGIAGGNAQKNQKGVKLLSCQIFQDDAGAGGAAAIKWGADKGAVISQNSWGYVVDSNNDGIISPDELEAAKNMSISSAEKAAVDYFIQYAGCDNLGKQRADSPMKGGVVIFAAGNDAIKYGAPANYTPIIAVGAINSDGYRSSFSNYGDWVDIAAPGSNIYSTYPGNQYGYMSGTSMACPHVSGVAALVVSYHGGVGFTNEMLTNRLIEGANHDILPKNSNIGPLVDALGAITYGSTDVPGAVMNYTASGVSNNVDFSWKVTGSSKKVPAFGYVLIAGTDRSLVESVNPANPSASLTVQAIEVPEGAKVGDDISGRLSGLEFDTDYYVAIAGYDYSHNFSPLSTIKSVRTGPNNPPVITIDVPEELIVDGIPTIPAFRIVNIPVTIEDPDGHSFNYTFTDVSGAAALTAMSPTTFILKLTCRVAEPGNYTAHIKATDSYNATTDKEFQFTILENRAPVKTKDFENILTSKVGKKSTFSAAEYFDDPDGEPLTYTFAISNKNVAHLNPSGEIFYLTILGYGLTDVTVTAKDALGKSVDSSFKILVRSGDVLVDFYPNPVSTTLFVRTGEDEVPTNVELVSSTGAVVYRKTETFSALYPLEIDMKPYSPGIYTLKVSYSGNSFSSKVAKK